MKVLVTGSTGFIGGYVITELLERGINVIATSTNITHATAKSWFPDVVYVEHDIQKPSIENLFEKFEKPDALIHLAWGKLDNFKDQVHLDEILPKHELFLQNLIANGLKDLTVIGTCLEYGMKEGELHEEMSPDPIIAYPIAKNKLRQFLDKFSSETSISLKWVRLFYMYGNGQSKKSILSQLDVALERNDEVFNMSLGEQQRDYLPVNEVAENIVIFALQREINGIINCCSNIPITIKQLVLDHLKKKNKTIKLNLGYYPYTDYEPFKFWGNHKKQLKIKSL
ncbi:MAG: NAD-dependent epimerase/dehydratase family protein [Bacteroidetes bacterium]|nr:NAD-dependent epimerase/dehydratase family protein [Bacteroidota bacterium]